MPGLSSKDQEKEGFSIPAQLRLLRDYATNKGFVIAQEFTDVETAKASGRTNFNQMLLYLKKHHAVCRTILVEKTDRLYRNIKDYATVDEFDVEVHFVKENEIISRSSRSNEQFVHGIKVLMARNYSQNLGEETVKGMTEKACAGIYPSCAPVGYRNADGPSGRCTWTSSMGGSPRSFSTSNPQLGAPSKTGSSARSKISRTPPRPPSIRPLKRYG